MQVETEWLDLLDLQVLLGLQESPEPSQGLWRTSRLELLRTYNVSLSLPQFKSV